MIKLTACFISFIFLNIVRESVESFFVFKCRDSVDQSRAVYSFPEKKNRILMKWNRLNLNIYDDLGVPDSDLETKWFDSHELIVQINLINPMILWNLMEQNCLNEM